MGKLKRWNRPRAGYCEQMYPYLDPRRQLAKEGKTICSKCKKEKKLEEFRKKKGNVTERDSWCKRCTGKYCKHPEGYMKEYMRKYRKRKNNALYKTHI